MILSSRLAVSDAVVRSLESFWASLLDQIPSLIAAGLFVVLAAVVISSIRVVAGRAIRAALPEDDELIVRLGLLVLSVFLWFAVLLVTLDILGMGEIAASLGTAAGFIGLGISYALSHVVADTVAGVYLLRDPDFELGDRVTTKSVTGTVVGLGLRKTRLETDEGDVVVLANSDVDEQWRRLETAAGEGGSE